MGFFGLEIKHNKNQAKPLLLDHHLKLSQAVLEPSKNGKKEPVCLMVEHDKKEFILCVLEPQCWQSQLDLEFEEGDQLRFFLRGSGNVHLTGIKYRDEDDALSLSISTDEDLSGEDDEGELEPVDDELSSKKKVSGQIPAKRIPARVSNGKAAVKPGLKKKLDQEADSNEEDESSDDDDYVLGESSDNDDDENEDESGDDEDMDDEDDEIDIDEEEDDDE